MCPSIEALACTVECSNVCSGLSIVSPTDLLTLGFFEDCGTIAKVEIAGTALGVTSAKTVDESKVGFVGEGDDGLKNSSVIDVNMTVSVEEADGTTEGIPDVTGVVMMRMLLVVVEGTTIDDSTASGTWAPLDATCHALSSSTAVRQDSRLELRSSSFLLASIQPSMNSVTFFLSLVISSCKQRNLYQSITEHQTSTIQ